ncbi:MAG: TetR/AcrR family transcriptional regulator [Actinobacteria bacterium]|nr:TetR/AcrR family transcriptional regulator [Actinomycetota bacterium]
MAMAGRSQEILDTFTRHVAEFGYDGTSFSRIAEELELSKGTIVHHFGTKDRLFAAMQERYMRRRLAEARTLVDRLSSPAEQLAAVFYAVVLAHVEDRASMVANQREVIRLARHESMREARRLRAEYRELVIGLLEAGVRATVFRPGDDRLRTLLVFGSVQWLWTWFDPDGESSVEEVAAAVVDVVLGGLLVDRSDLERLADPDGPIVELVRASIAEPVAT